MNTHSNAFRFLCLLLAQLLCCSLVAETEDPFSNRVNLALRQTGHQLLLLECDSTSKIAPVEYKGDHGYLLPLQSTFDYNALPGILAQSLADFNITESYELLVRSCDSSITLLGYNLAARDRGEVACRGRESEITCANIFIQFSIEKESSSYAMSTLLWVLLPFLAGLGVLVFKRKNAKDADNLSDGLISLGGLRYDPVNQLIVDGEEEITLTFRENKLLRHFASQPNQVLARADILSVVWEDEGVIVGRSLDVFISRLRKILKRDPSIQITNVHGVGYRLNIS